MQEKVNARLRESRLLAPSGRGYRFHAILYYICSAADLILLLRRVPKELYALLTIGHVTYLFVSLVFKT